MVSPLNIMPPVSVEFLFLFAFIGSNVQSFTRTIFFRMQSVRQGKLDLIKATEKKEVVAVPRLLTKSNAGKNFQDEVFLFAHVVIAYCALS